MVSEVRRVARAERLYVVGPTNVKGDEELRSMLLAEAASRGWKPDLTDEGFEDTYDLANDRNLRVAWLNCYWLEQEPV